MKMPRCGRSTQRGSHPGREEGTLKLSLRDMLGVIQAKEVGRALQGKKAASSKERPARSVSMTTGHLVRPEGKEPGEE